MGAALSQVTAQGRLINFGYSASWALARAELLDGADLSRAAGPALSYLTGPGWRQPASGTAVELIEARLASSTIIGSPFFDPAELRRRGQSPRADLPGDR